MTPAGRRSIELHLAQATPRVTRRRWLTWRNLAGAVAMLVVAYLLLLLTTNLSP